MDITTGQGKTLYEQPGLIDVSISLDDKYAVILSQQDSKSAATISCILEINGQQCRSLAFPIYQIYHWGWIDSNRFSMRDHRTAT